MEQHPNVIGKQSHIAEEKSKSKILSYMFRIFALFFLFQGNSLYSQNTYYTLRSGLWSNTSNVWSSVSHTGAVCSCSPGTSLGGSNVVNIYNSVSSSSSLSSISGTGKITIQSGDTLTITTPTLTIGGSGSIVINAGAVFILNGALNMSGGTIITNNGKSVINGNVTNSGSATIANNSSFVIYGNLSTSGGALVNGSSTLEVSGTVSGPGTTTVGNLPSTWGLSGNAGTSSKTNFLGTTDTAALSLRTNNTEQIRINNDGSLIFRQYGGKVNGLLLTNTNGTLQKLYMSGRNTDVLTGDGTWGTLAQNTGWTVNNSVITSQPTFSVNIGVPVKNTLKSALLTVYGPLGATEDIGTMGSVYSQQNIYAQQNITAGGTITTNGLTITPGGPALAVDSLVANKVVVINGLTLEGAQALQKGGVPYLNGVNGISPTNADLLINCRVKSPYNTILNAGAYSSGSVGIGTLTPSVKLDVFGDIRGSGFFTVSGNISSGGIISSKGGFSTGQSVIAGNMHSTGSVQIDSNLVIQGTIISNKPVSFGSDLNVSGNISAGGAISSKGGLTTGQSVTAGNLYSTGNATIDSNLVVKGSLLNNGPANFGGNMTVAGNVSTNGTLTTGKAITTPGMHSTGSMLVDSNLVVNGTISSSKPIAFGNDLNVNGNITAGGTISTNGGLTSSKSVTAANLHSTGSVVIDSNLVVNGTISSNTPLNFGNNLTVAGNITAGGTITATGINIVQKILVDTIASATTTAVTIAGLTMQYQPGRSWNSGYPSVPATTSISPSVSNLAINSNANYVYHTIINANNAGFVGIGTATPIVKLDVHGDARTTGNLIAGGNLSVYGNTTFFGGLNFKGLHSTGSVQIDSSLVVSGATASFSPSTRVGIGTATPVSALDVLGDIHSTGSIVANSLTLNSTFTVDTMYSRKKILVNSGLSLQGDGNIQGPNSIDASGADLLINSNGLAPTLNTILNAKSNGFVGIGNIHPQYKLDVQGDINTSGALHVGTGLAINGTIHSLGNVQIDSSLTVNGNFKIAGAYQVSGNTSIGGSLDIGKALTFNGGQQAMKFTPVGGSNIHPTLQFGGGPGIPPISPCLNLGNNTWLNQFNDGIQISPTIGSAVLNLGFDGTNNIIDSWGTNAAGNTSLLLDYYCGNDVGICTGTNGGNVNICNGTNTTGAVYLGPTRIGPLLQHGPNSHANAFLTVSGEMVAQSCFITMDNWADYVFAPNYRLPKLFEVEKYYKSYGHLPEIPSEEKIKEEGLNVGEMNKLLLKKIEELTLYVVAQQKQIDELKATIGKK